MSRNMGLWISETIAAPVKLPLPILTFPVIQLMGITVRELISDSATQAQAMKLLADRNRSLCAVSMMDLSVEAEAFGSEIQVNDHEVPVVRGKIIADQEDADRLAVPEIGTGRTRLYIDAIGKAAQTITDRPVLAGVIGPYSLAGRLVGTAEIMKASRRRPELVHTVMAKCTQFITAYVEAYREAGADGVFMAEPLTGLLSPKMAEDFSEPYVRQIVEQVQREDFIVMYHNCGDSAVNMLSSILRTGARGYHFGNAIRMKDAVEGCPDNVLCMGNVKPGTFVFGTPQEIYQETRQIMEECGGHPNFVISSGCDIPPIAKWENIDSFYQAAASCGG